MEANLVYATFFKIIKGPRAKKISRRAALWPRLFYRIGYNVNFDNILQQRFRQYSFAKKISTQPEDEQKNTLILVKFPPTNSC